MAVPKCPPFVNFLILAVGVLLVGYVIVTFVRAKPFDYSKKDGFADLGAGNFCSGNADCGSGRCGQLDGGKRRCF